MRLCSTSQIKPQRGLWVCARPGAFSGQGGRPRCQPSELDIAIPWRNRVRGTVRDTLRAPAPASPGLQGPGKCHLYKEPLLVVERQHHASQKSELSASFCNLVAFLNLEKCRIQQFKISMFQLRLFLRHEPSDAISHFPLLPSFDKGLDFFLSATQLSSFKHAMFRRVHRVLDHTIWALVDPKMKFIWSYGDRKKHLSMP